MTPLSALARLAGLAWVLVRADALVAARDHAPAARLARRPARGLRLLAGPQARRPARRAAGAGPRARGPVAIKLGQLLSTRADIFGVAFADDLAA